MIVPTQLTPEQLQLLDATNNTTMAAQAEALAELMRSKGWAVYSAMMQQYELTHFSEMLTAKVSGEALIRAQAGLIAVNNLRMWPARQTEAILRTLVSSQ